MKIIIIIILRGYQLGEKSEALKRLLTAQDTELQMSIWKDLIVPTRKRNIPKNHHVINQYMHSNSQIDSQQQR